MGKQYSHFPKDKEQEVCNLYQSGLGALEIAHQFGYKGSNTILRILARHNIPRRKQPKIFTPEEEQDVVNRYIEGEAMESLRIFYKTDPQKIKRILIDHNIGPEDRKISPHSLSKIGSRNHQWKGGRTYDHSGYVLIWVGPQSDTGSQRGEYVQEHRLVVERILGRSLEPWETVHHKDGQKTNNKPSNLEIHSSKHGAGITMRCRCCGSNNIVAEELA